MNLDQLVVRYIVRFEGWKVAGLRRGGSCSKDTKLISIKVKIKVEKDKLAIMRVGWWAMRASVQYLYQHEKWKSLSKKN